MADKTYKAPLALDADGIRLKYVDQGDGTWVEAGIAVGAIGFTAISSASRTATNNSGDLTNLSGRGIHVIVDASVNAGGLGSITLTIQGKDPASGNYYTLLAGAAVVTVVTNVYKVYPGLTAAANAVASDVLPRTYRLLITHNNANPVTYSVGVSIIV